MKRKLLIFFLVILFFSCTSDTNDQTQMNLTIRLTGNPQCKGSKSADISSVTSQSESCLEYAFDQDNRKLILKHVNAGFNCCPDSLWCEITYRNDTITIREFEKHQGCKCDCLYDLDIEVEGLEPGKYYIQLKEPYCGDQEELCEDLDLLAKKQGVWCVNRTKYPW
jgi:hypothetical protein